MSVKKTQEGRLRANCPFSRESKEDGCDLDRMYVRDKRFVWTSELNWTDRRELIKKKKERITSFFNMQSANLSIYLIKFRGLLNRYNIMIYMYGTLLTTF